MFLFSSRVIDRSNPILQCTDYIALSQRPYSTLPVRPRPIAGEAMFGYLLRVARANGYNTLAQLGTAFSSFEALCQALKLTVAEKAKLFGPLPGFWRLTNLSEGLSGIDFNHTRLRWCPSCMKESVYLRGIWSVEVAGICNRHGVRLIDQCPNCGRVQKLERVNFEQCSCGALLFYTRSVEKVHGSILHISQVFEDSLNQKTAYANLPPLAFAEWVRLITYLGQFSKSFQPTKPGKIARLYQVNTAMRLMSQIAYLLENWPKNFYQLLSALHRQSDEKLSIRRTFGPLYRVLYIDLSDACFQFLRDEFEHYLIECWPGVVCGRHRAFQAETIAAHPRQAWKQAAKQAGIAPSIIRHLIRAELILADEIDLPSGRTVRSIDKKQLKQLTDLARAGFTLKEAAYRLALPESRVRALITDEFIEPLVSRLHGNAATWLIPERQMRRLYFIGRELNQLPATITISKILKHWRLREGEFKALVQALLLGRLIPVGTRAEYMPLGKLVLDELEVRQWFTEVRDAAGVSLSIDEAAKRLGLKQQVAYNLIKAGLLETIQDDLPGRRITPVALKTFQESYISLAEYARLLNRAPRSVLQSLEAQPVSGPTIDGSRQYFYRCFDLCSERSSS